MKTFFKIIFLLIVLAALSLTVAYTLYKDVLHEKIRERIVSELSLILRHPVEIASVKYIPFQSVSADRVTVFSLDKSGVKIASADTVTITFDIASLVKNKQLQTTVTAESLRVNGMILDASIRTHSRKAETYKKVFDSSLFDSVFIIEADLTAKSFALSEIVGTMQVDKMKISGCKISFKHKDIRYLVDAEKTSSDNPGYNITLKSENLNLRTTLSMDANNLLAINDLDGMFYTLHFDLEGEIKNFRSPQMACSLSGTVETELASLASVPGKTGKAARVFPLSGKVRSDIDLTTKSPFLKEYELSAFLTADDIKIDKIRVPGIAGKLDIVNGQLNAPLLKGLLYEGTFACDITMDLNKQGLPALFKMTVNDVDFKSLMRDVTNDESDIHGTLNSDVSLESYAKNPSTIRGRARITISEADLGPVPLLSPLFGNIFSAMQNIFPGMNKVQIGEAYADFDIKNRRITTTNLTLQGDSVAITAEGYVDFDGNLDVSFQNQIRHPETEKEDWQTLLRDGIVGFGKLISRAHLRGTIRKPKWEFEYLNPIKGMISRNLKNLLGVF